MRVGDFWPDVFFLGGGNCWREGDRKFVRDLRLYCWEGCKVR